ncbi:hypothetical protein L3Q82_025976, partial [Scortum barcoo]
IDDVCSSYLSADLKFWASDVLGELCVLMLVQKSKELKVRENSKRTTGFCLVTGGGKCECLSVCCRRLLVEESGGDAENYDFLLFELKSVVFVSIQAELQGPGGIQSRGYFLYRPRNGRRSLEYE